MRNGIGIKYKIIILIFLISVIVSWLTAVYYLNFNKHALILNSNLFLYNNSNTTKETILDRDRYDSVAKNISFYGTIGKVGESFFHPPLYPFFLVIFYSLFGYNIYSLLLPQIILAAINAILIFLLAQYLFNNRGISIAASLFYALNPHFILISIQLYSETLYFFLLLSVFLSFSKLLSKSTISNSVVVGILMGLATLCRSVFLVFIPFVFAWLIIVFSNQKKELLVTAFSIFLSFSFVCGLWVFRNYKIFNRIFFSKEYKIVLAKSMREGYPSSDKYMKEYKNEELAFINWVKGNTWQYLRLCKKRLITFVLKGHTKGVSLRHKIVSSIIFYVVFPLGYLGIIAKIRERKEIPLLILLYIFSTTTLHILTYLDGELRYRLPIELFMGVFACYGFSVIANLSKRLIPVTN
jgi:4-amino-4-deoxy-L-arabinose transferase-like glycosyltransferase